MANNVLGTKITDLEEAQAEGLTDDALLIVEPETLPTKRSKLSTFFTWVKGKLAAWILSSYDEVMAATEAGYLVDALAVKDGFTQLNTNLGKINTSSGVKKSQAGVMQDLCAAYLKAGHDYIVSSRVGLTFSDGSAVIQATLAVVGGSVSGFGTSATMRSMAVNGGGVGVTALLHCDVDAQINLQGYTNSSGSGNMEGLMGVMQIK